MQKFENIALIMWPFDNENTWFIHYKILFNFEAKKKLLLQHYD